MQTSVAIFHDSVILPFLHFACKKKIRKILIVSDNIHTVIGSRIWRKDEYE